jgi:CDP-glycerol glycerophosphotransferase
MGSVAAVAEQLRSDSPDVLLVDHVHVSPLGRSRPGPNSKALARAAKRGPGPLDEHPGLESAAPRAWNKVFRRAHLDALGARFGPGRYSELTVTWPALLGAARIAALAAPSYERRTPANASPEGGAATDVFAQYDTVLAAAGERRSLVVPAMRRHLLGLLERVPERDRRAFFHQMAERFGATLGDATPAGGRVGRLRTRLVAGDRYGAFLMLERSLERRRSLKGWRGALGRRRRKLTARRRRSDLRRHYRAQLELPIDPDLAVFASYWYRGYSCNPRAIYEKARELVPGMRGVWVVKRDAVDSLPAGVDHVVSGTREYYETIARARYLVNNVNFPNHLVKRKGSVHVMTHHGTPLKRMGLDQRHSPGSAERIDFAALLRRCARWDYSVSSNALSTLVWERVYPLRYESLEVGYPRNDVLATAGDDEMRRARAELGIDPGQVAVLYAPTHREYQEGFEPTFDLGAVADALGPGFVLLARLHYFYESDPVLRELHAAGRVRDVAAHPSIEELCLAADVLVTDYSSIMFDYAVLDRPIVVHAPDWDVYRAMRGTTFDLMEEPPGTVTATDAELVEALRSDGDPGAAARAAFRARFCSLDDGRAAERVVRRVWFGERLAAEDRVPEAVG